MNCPRCGSLNYCKDGKVNNRQRYLCKDCVYRYTVNQKSGVKSREVRRMALEMYLEGLGFRAIGRILKISYGTVYHWVKEWGSKVDLPQRKGVVDVVELDEIHTYVASKKTTVGYGLLLIDLENGFSLLSVETAPPKLD
jgi:transposase-like protein